MSEMSSFAPILILVNKIRNETKTKGDPPKMIDG
jgi:hypothetical protein